VIDFTKIKAVGALNVERLFDLWGVEYKNVNECELDFINSARGDRHYGACRYNFVKDIGSDFAAGCFSDDQFKALGPAFDARDFNLDASQQRMGFDIVGLTKMLFGCVNNAEAADRLARDLNTLHAISPIATISDEAIAQRKRALEQKKFKRVDFARSLLTHCVSYKGTLGETYLASRAIHLTGLDTVIRYHPSMQHEDNGVKSLFPALIFPIQNIPGGTVEGIHRIFLQDDGNGKAKVKNPKMALGTVKGNAIWFGEPSDRLYIAEGPENALSIYASGAKFVACSINAGNMSHVSIPETVTSLVICADRDKAGIEAARSTAAIKALEGMDIEFLYPELRKLANGKFADFNDILRNAK